MSLDEWHTYMPTGCSLVLLEIGLAAFDESDNLISSKKFSNAIDSYLSLKNGESPQELYQIIEKLRSFENISVNDRNIDLVLKQNGLSSQLMTLEEQLLIQNRKPNFIVRAGFMDSEYNAVQALKDFAIDLSSAKVGHISEKLDLHIIQAINSLDELDKIINTLGSRMREWYGLHFPELDNLIQSLTLYAEIVQKAGLRVNINRELLEMLDLQEKKREVIMDAANRSKGGSITQENLLILQKLGAAVIAQSELRKILEGHLENAMEAIAPNTKELLTASIGARMIAKAGSLGRLASLSASTIQILGAEKALFRALKTGMKPPKHGVIFQHPLVHSAPTWQRGKIARVLAAKVAIGARIDLYRHGTKDNLLLEKLNARISYIQARYKEPPIITRKDKRYIEHNVEGRRHGNKAKNKQSKRRRDRNRFGRRRF
jgi:nucleolar protein 56